MREVKVSGVLAIALLLSMVQTLPTEGKRQLAVAALWLLGASHPDHARAVDKPGACPEVQSAISRLHGSRARGERRWGCWGRVGHTEMKGRSSLTRRKVPQRNSRLAATLAAYRANSSSCGVATHSRVVWVKSGHAAARDALLCSASSASSNSHCAAILAPAAPQEWRVVGTRH